MRKVTRASNCKIACVVCVCVCVCVCVTHRACASARFFVRTRYANIQGIEIHLVRRQPTVNFEACSTKTGAARLLICPTWSGTWQGKNHPLPTIFILRQSVQNVHFFHLLQFSLVCSFEGHHMRMSASPERMRTCSSVFSLVPGARASLTVRTGPRRRALFNS